MSERATVDLSRFDNSKTFRPGASVLKRTLWFFVNALIFQNPAFPFRSPKPGLLRLFGARVGPGVVIHPSVNIKFPWKLSIAHHSWLGPRACLDNLDTLTIGNNVVISQGAMTGLRRKFSKGPNKLQAFAEILPFTVCATALLLTCWKRVLTSGI